MILLDAQALIAFLEAEPAADEVAELLRTGKCVVSAANFGEVLDFLFRRRQMDREEVTELIGSLVLPIRAVGEREAWRAAAIRAQHYDRAESDLSLADCFLLAAASSGDTIATSDPAVLGAARAEGIETIALPDSSG